MKGHARNLNNLLKNANDTKLAQKEGNEQWLDFKELTETHNPKTTNPEELNQFEYTATEKRIRWSYECHQGQCYNKKHPISWQVASNYIRQNVVP